MKLPRHINLTIEHNPHAVYYETVEQYAERNAPSSPPFDWTSDEERDRAIAANELWVIQWYPSTPVGFCALGASTLEALLAALETVDPLHPA